MIAGSFPWYGAQRPPVAPSGLARAILSQSRFRVPVFSPPHRTIWDLILQWFGAQWQRLMDAFVRHVHIGRSVTVALGDIALIAVLAIVIIVAVRLLANNIRDAAYSERRTSFGRGLDADALYERSLASARQGDYEHAIALLFRAAIMTLDEQGVLADDPSRTVNQCRRAVRSRSPAAASWFETIAHAFTAVLYAEEPIAQAQWQESLEAYLSLLHRRTDAA